MRRKTISVLLVARSSNSVLQFFWFVFKVLLEKNCLHTYIICYAAVSLVLTSDLVSAIQCVILYVYFMSCCV